MRSAVLNLPLSGHINPTLPLVAELAAQGEELTYLASGAFAGAIGAAGGRFLPLAGAHQLLADGRTRALQVVRGMLAVALEWTGRWLEQVRAIDPHYLLFGSACFWGKYVAGLAGKPAIGLSGSLLLAPDRLRAALPGLWQDEACLRGLESLAARYGAAPALGDLLINEAPLNVVFTSRAFQPDADRFPASYRFVGMRPPERPPTPGFLAGREEPVVYVSLGTLFNDDPEFYRCCFAALGELRCTVVVAAGGGTDLAALGEPPANFVLLPRVDQIAVLARARCFVSHGGMNSANEALCYGVPLVLLPQHREQPIISRRIAELGAGIVLDRAALDPALLRAAVLRLLDDRSYAARSREIGETIRGAGGAAEGARAIVAHVRGGR